MDMSIGALWAQMGWFARIILFVLIGMSILSLTVAFFKWKRMRTMAKATRVFAPLFSEALENDSSTTVAIHAGATVSTVMMSTRF